MNQTEIIQQLNDFFKNFKLPENPIILSTGETIIDVKKFLDVHLKFINNKENQDGKLIEAYIDRLIKLTENLK